MVLVGPSGCGKTTLLRMVAGLEQITTGTIRIGETVINDIEPKNRDLAMVFQNYALYPHMTCYDNMAFALKLRQRAEARRSTGACARRPRRSASRTQLEAAAGSSRADSGSAWPWAGRSCASRRRS